MKKLFTKEVLTRGIGIGVIAGFVMIIIVGYIAHADTTISTFIDNTTDGVLSTPVLSLSGNWFANGDLTTTKPHVLIEPTGTTSSDWSKHGTGLGINAASGFNGNIADFQLNGNSLFRVASTGNASLVGTFDVSGDVTKNGTSVLTPAGTMSMFAGADAPAGYLLCDGSAYLTSAYPDLFSVIGYTYGGAGSTFNVPDMRGRFADGVSSGVANISNKTLGQVGGEETHTLSTNEMPSHNLNVNVPVGNGTIMALNSIIGQPVPTAGSQIVTTDSIGGGNPFNVLSPYLAVNYIIKY